MAPGPRRNSYTICRPLYCAGLLFPHRPTGGGGLCGDRGCSTGDHLTIDVLRYPDPLLVRAILMARAPPFFPLANHLPSGYCTAYCWSCELPVPRTAAALDSAALRQPAPSPVLHLPWLGTPLPNFPARAPAADAFTGEPLKNRTAGTAVLLLAAPDHCGPPGPTVSPVAVLRQPWLRNSTAVPSCAIQLPTTARQFVSAGPFLISATRETITGPPSNVYSSQHRFSCTRLRDSHPRTVKGTGARMPPCNWGQPLRPAPSHTARHGPRPRRPSRHRPPGAGTAPVRAGPGTASVPGLGPVDRAGAAVPGRGRGAGPAIGARRCQVSAVTRTRIDGGRKGRGRGSGDSAEPDRA